MDKRLNLTEKLDFSDIDLTAPDKVIGEILSELPKETNGIVCGDVAAYEGPVFSYTKHSSLSAISMALGAAEDKKVDIQDSLGRCGEELHKFECYLYTPEYTKYKYRVFFVKYEIANYPVDIILDESISNSVFGSGSSYIHTCGNRAELEDLVVKILTSKKMIAVMQELIRINQSKKCEVKDMAEKISAGENDPSCAK